jgi:chaperonin GroES
MKRLQPLANRILVRPIAVEEKTLGGIIIPENDKNKPLHGEVIATGNGTKDEEMLVKAGDIVLYKNGTGVEIEHENEKYVLMCQFDVLVILK